MTPSAKISSQLDFIPIFSVSLNHSCIILTLHPCHTRKGSTYRNTIN
uniref:Uncharacterized protein n=1 Tax=Anguilla anguilla TaxID=7936 RepID=A0A0E9SJP0_ANGAN